MTKKELAERIGVDPKTLKNWETTKPELIKLINLGLATEQHFKETEEYIDKVKKKVIKSMNLIRIDHDNPNSTAYEGIPETAGIYGWYYNFKTLKDLNGDVLSRQLESISRNLRRVDLKTTATAPLSTYYKGELIEEYLLSFESLREKIEEIENNSNTNELITLLNDFSPPLYIGISVNLSKRYSQHIKDLEYCDIVHKKNCFGQRARERSIMKSYLTFKYYSMPSINSSSQKSIEFILNRFLKPIFGRK